MDTTSSPAAQASGVDFDVREIPCRIKHGQILQRWLDLPVGGHFVLINDHDPVPLRFQFEAEFADAFTWDYLERGPEVFRVRISKVAEANGSAASRRPPGRVAPLHLVADLDARGLEPPEPLVRILDALESLPPNASLRARTDREPCHLFPEALQRGFRHESSRQADGSWLTLLSRA